MEAKGGHSLRHFNSKYRRKLGLEMEFRGLGLRVYDISTWCQVKFVCVCIASA
jgi:hypothetical protein